MTAFTNPHGECADAAGNVFITDEKRNTIYKYAHGGTKPIEVIGDSTYHPESCAVDPLNGNLAIANFAQFANSGGNVAVYSRGGGKPIVYNATRYDHFIACAYDKRGDLLAVSAIHSSEFYYGDFYYLPKHGVQLLPMTLPGPSQSWLWAYTDFVFWDGRYWVVSAYDSLYRYSIDVKAHYEGSTLLLASDGDLNQVAEYTPLAQSHGYEVVGATQAFPSGGDIYYWKYPVGGNPIAQITKGLDQPYGVAISIGAQ